jgi:hypothetical protein
MVYMNTTNKEAKEPVYKEDNAINEYSSLYSMINEYNSLEQAYKEAYMIKLTEWYMREKDNLNLKKNKDRVML